MAGEVVKMSGVVVESKGRGHFTVLTETEVIITCTLSGNIRKNSIRIIDGDKVTVELSPYDLTRGRIVFREKVVK